MEYSTFHPNPYPQLRDPSSYLQPFGFYPSASAPRHMGYYASSEYYSKQWEPPESNLLNVGQLQSRHIIMSPPKKSNLPSAPAAVMNPFAPSPSNNRFAPSPLKNPFGPSPEKKLFGPSPQSSPIHCKTVFCGPSPNASKRKGHSSWKEKKYPSNATFREKDRGIHLSEHKVHKDWAFKEMIRGNHNNKDRGQQHRNYRDNSSGQPLGQSRHFEQRSHSRGNNQMRSAAGKQVENISINIDSGSNSQQAHQQSYNTSEDEIRMDLLKFKPDQVPQIHKSENIELPKYKWLKKFNWNGLSGRSWAAQQNSMFTQKEGHGIGCKCHSCSNLDVKEKKKKGSAQNKPAISILHEIATWEEASISLMITCGGCNLRFHEAAVQGGSGCPRCGESINSKTCEFGYAWNDQYLEGSVGASNNKEAKRLAADKALLILEKDWNYGEQITRCAKGSKALPRDPGRYIFVSDRGDFVPFEGDAKTLRERIFEQQRKYQKISYDMAPNFDWHQFDQKMKTKKAKHEIKNIPEKPVDTVEIVNDSSSIPNSNVTEVRKKKVWWDEPWNSTGETKAVNIDIKTFYSNGVHMEQDKISLSYCIDDLSMLFKSQRFDELSEEEKPYFKIAFRRKERNRYCFIYDKRFVAICHCRGEVIRPPSQRPTAKFYCSFCKTAWRYCSGCSEMKWPLEPSEIVCGQKCESKVDTATDTWFCKDCWKGFIFDKHTTPTSNDLQFIDEEVVSLPYIRQPPKPPLPTLPPKPPDSLIKASLDEPIKFKVLESSLPDFDVPIFLPPPESIIGTNINNGNFRYHKLPAMDSAPYYKALIRLKFERSREVKKEGVCFEQKFQQIPKIYTRILTKGLQVMVELEDHESFVVKAQLEEDCKPGDYSFEYIVVS